MEANSKSDHSKYTKSCSQNNTVDRPLFTALSTGLTPYKGDNGWNADPETPLFLGQPVLHIKWSRFFTSQRVAFSL